MRKIKKHKLLASLLIAMMMLIPTSVFAYDCETAIRDRDDWKEKMDLYCAVDPYGSPCVDAKKHYGQAVTYIEQNDCEGGGCEVNGYSWTDTGYRSGGHIIGRFYTGEETFCVQPDQLFTVCGKYTASNVSYGATETIIKAIYGYNHTAKTNEHYAAAQAMIWGTEIPAGCESAYQEILSKYPENTSKSYSTNWQYKTFSMDMNTDSNDLDLGNTISMTDKYSVNFPSGISGSRNGDSVSITLNNIYPLSKKVDVSISGSNPSVENSNGGNVNARLLSSSTSQNFVMFDGNIAALNYTYYYADSFIVETKTGTLELNKLNEWKENAGAGSKYQIWYAVEDENGTAISEDGIKYSKYQPFQTESDWNNGVAQSTFTTNDDGTFNVTLPSGGTFNDGTPIGTYIIQEIDTTNPYVVNTKEYVFKIEHNKTTTLSVTNDYRITELDIYKKDIEEAGSMESEDLYLNGATFEIYDISNTLDTKNNTNPIINNYFLKKGKSVDLNTLFASDSVVANNDNLTYKLVNEHCDTVRLENNVLTALKNDVVKIHVLKGKDVLITLNVYIINDDNELGSEDYFIISGIGQFKGVTGQNYVQLVDPEIHSGHYLPIPYGELNLYYDEELTELYKTYKADFFGMVDFSNEVAKGDGVDDNDGIFYYQKVAGYNEVGKVDGYYVTESITQDELNNGFKKDRVEKGKVDVDYLKHSRTYLICESNTPSNYDIPNDENACFILNTSDYDEYTISKDITRSNRKGRGDLSIQKLNEWLEEDGRGVKFKLYHAKYDTYDETGDYNLTYDEYALDENRVVFDEYNRPEKGELIKNPVTGEEWFTVDEKGQINLYDYLYFGYYVLEEYEDVNVFDHDNWIDEIDGQPILLRVEHSKETHIDFVNENRTVSFDVFKQDVEENYRKLNDTEFTIYDISDVLDIDDQATDLGLYGDLTSDDDVDTDFNVSPYNVESLHFIKIGKTADLYELLIANEEDYKDFIGNKPIKYILKHTESGTVDTNGYFNAIKTGFVDIEIVGGAYTLYGTAGGKEIYEKTYFDPYADLIFFEDEHMQTPIEVESIEYNGDFDIKTPGEYILHYTLISKAHVKYEFDRIISVIEDTRHVCKYDPTNENWYYADTKEICDEIDLGMNVDYSEPKLVPLILTNFEDDGTWKDTFIKRDRVYVINDDESITSGTPTSVINGLAVFRGLTGHSYIQLVDFDNHNLPLANKELITYYDPELKYPYKKYVSDEFGMIDVSNENNGELLAPLPSKVNKDSNGYYIEKAVAKTQYTCVVNGYNHNEEDNLCYSEDKSDTLPAIEETIYEIEKVYLEDYEPIDEEMNVDSKPQITSIYYLEREIPRYDGTIEKQVKEVVLHEDNGKINAQYLKHSRQYLVCETELSEGYDFLDGQNACFLLDTGSYEEGIENANTTRDNYLRRLDVVLYKTNESKNIKLNGAVFDVWETFEENKDINEIEGNLEELGVFETNQGTLFYGEPIFFGTDENGELIPFATDENGACKLPNYSGGDIDDDMMVDYDDGSDYIGVNDSGNETSEEYPVGMCYRKYKPNLKGRKYLGRYVSGGIHLTYTNDEVNEETEEIITKPLVNAMVEVSTDPNFTNIIKKVTTNDNGQVKVLGLADGIYYTRLQRPLKPEFTGEKIDEEGNIVVILPTEDDYIPLEELPEAYSQTRKHYVSKGTIHLPDIKYGHTLEFKEIEAPEGYYFDDSITVIVPKAPYGIHRMENYRINNAIIIPQTGISKYLSIVFDCLNILPFKR